MGIGHFTVGGGTLFQLANTLSNIVGQAVVDRTGLTGNFDIDLTWTPEQTAQRPPDTQDPPRTDPDGPSIFTALQEQLSLDSSWSRRRLRSTCSSSITLSIRSRTSGQCWMG
jgi:uncharacterized protein (TIGR03435 family)